MKKKTVIIIACVLVVAVVAVVLLVNSGGNAANSASAAQQMTGVVVKQPVSVTVHGSGTLSAANTTDVIVPVSAAIDKIHYEVGDTVKAGDLLASLKSDTLDTEITTLTTTLTEQTSALSGGSNSTGSSYISAPASGRVKEINVKADDDVSIAMGTYTNLMTLSTDGKMKVEFEPKEGVNAGDEVTVKISDSNGESTETGHIMNSPNKGKLIAIIDSDTYDVNIPVTILNEDGKEVGGGSDLLQVNKPVPIIGTTGKVSKVYKSYNQTVDKGDNLIYVKSQKLSADYDTKVRDREQTIQDLSDAREKLEKLSVYAECDGIVSELNGNAGSQASEGATLMKISNTENFELKAEVDELDIAKVQVGQSVKLTIDALEDRTFDGTVTKINPIGTASSGVTTYPVTIEVPQQEGMLIGMSADADIQVEYKEDALVVPVEAIISANDKKMIMAPAAVTDGNPMGIELKEVTTGIVTATLAEITSGLNEGDSILYTPSSSENNVRGNMMMMGGGMMGGSQPVRIQSNDGGRTFQRPSN